MRVVIQRVLKSQVKINGQPFSQIDKGLLVYISVAATDTLKDAEFIAEKLVNMRIFADQAGKMNLSLLDVGGQSFWSATLHFTAIVEKAVGPALTPQLKPGWAGNSMKN